MKRTFAALVASSAATLLLAGCIPLGSLPLPGKEKETEETTASAAPSPTSQPSTTKSTPTRTSTPKTSTPKTSSSKEPTSRTSTPRPTPTTEKMDAKLRGALEALLEPDLTNPKTDRASGTLHFDKTTGELTSITNYKVNDVPKDVPAERLDEVRNKIKGWKPKGVDKVRLLEFDFENNFISAEYFG
ncbi:hypothetical protein J5O04_06010 [Corynebacterium hindlerae]|uniref:hypothetical protein n=1 Tax=Corynebacterium hindlerae TaxID=699041 RepID=UPI001AD71DCE|nr:hypothetical protein [Corynebacterium hindlerae]QTH60654.1 hypothetical protein J5O04_06010 [Corynebacterium hindlerae]